MVPAMRRGWTPPVEAALPAPPREKAESDPTIPKLSKNAAKKAKKVGPLFLSLPLLSLSISRSLPLSLSLSRARALPEVRGGADGGARGVPHSLRSSRLC